MMDLKKNVGFCVIPLYDCKLVAYNIHMKAKLNALHPNQFYPQ